MLELGLHCCMWAFCSFIEQGLLSNCGVQVLIVVASLVEEPSL